MGNINAENILFRKLKKADAELFIKLRMAYIMETFDTVRESDIEEIKRHLKLYFYDHINKNDFIGIIGEYDGNIVSAAYLVIKDFPPNPNIKNGKTGTLLNVYTFPEYRKNGIAKKLITKMLEEAKKLGVNSIDLKATGAGYPLYKSLGFVDDDKYKNMILSPIAPA